MVQRFPWCVLLIASGCATVLARPTPFCAGSASADGAMPAAGSEWERTELYFGRAIHGGGEVSDDDWRQFVAHEICPRFPGGFTLLDATGEWRSPSGELVGEASHILLLLHSRSARDDIAIDEIRAKYRETSRQDSVLRVDEAAKVSF